MEDYKHTMGRVRASDSLKNRIKHSAELGVAPRPLGERRAVRPGVGRALTIAATIAVTLVVLTAFVLLVRFVGPQGRPSDTTGEIGIAPGTPNANGFSLISVSTGREDVTVRVDNGTARGSVGFTWINDTDSKLTFGSIFRAFKLVDGEWVTSWGNNDIDQGIVFDAVAHIVMPHTEVKDSMSLSVWSDKILPGKYKMERDYRVDGEKHTLVIEFELTENATAVEGFKLISCTTDTSDVTVEFGGGSADGAVSYVWVNHTDREVTYGEYVKALKYVDGRWIDDWSENKVEVTVQDIARLILPNSRVKDSMSLANYGDPITVGRYKFERNFNVNGEKHTLTIEFELTAKQEAQISDNFELISMDVDTDKATVEISGYNDETKMLELSRTVADGYVLYNPEHEPRSIYQMVDGDWKCLTDGEPTISAFVYAPVGDTFDIGLRAGGEKLGAGHYKLVKKFLVSPVGHATGEYGEPEGEYFKLVIEFRLTEKEEETQFPLGTGWASVVTIVDCGNDVSDKCPGLTAEVVDFDDDKNILWVDFKNNGTQNYRVEASYALIERYENGNEMISDANGAFSVTPDAVTHTSFALSDWRNGEILSGEYALLLTIDGQSVRLNFDLMIAVP